MDPKEKELENPEQYFAQEAPAEEVITFKRPPNQMVDPEAGAGKAPIQTNEIQLQNVNPQSQPQEKVVKLDSDSNMDADPYKV